MRRGIDDSAESRDKFFEIFDGAFDRGVAAITVHGRTVEQRYVGPSRWEFLREVKQPRRRADGAGQRRPVHGAGLPRHDPRQTGVDGVTAARGAIGNPWIFSQARAWPPACRCRAPPSVFEQRDVIAEHYRLSEEIYGPEHCGRQMRKFGIKYSQLHPHGQEVRDAFVAVSRPGEWMSVLESWYAEDLPGRHAVPEGSDSDTCEEPVSGLSGSTILDCHPKCGAGILPVSRASELCRSHERVDLGPLRFLPVLASRFLEPGVRSAPARASRFGNAPRPRQTRRARAILRRSARESAVENPARVGLVSQHDRGVAQQASPLGAPQRRVAEPARKAASSSSNSSAKLQRRDSRAWLEVRLVDWSATL